MARVKRAVNAQKKRRVVLEQASGYRGQRSRLYRKAKEQVTHSLVYAYRDRKKRKGDFRQLWIQRINAAARSNGMTYNRFIQGLKAAGVELDRKVLADLAVNDAPAFAALVEVARAALPAREAAVRLLTNVLGDGHAFDGAVAKEFQGSALEPRDRALARLIAATASSRRCAPPPPPPPSPAGVYTSPGRRRSLPARGAL